VRLAVWNIDPLRACGGPSDCRPLRFCPAFPLVVVHCGAPGDLAVRVGRQRSVMTMGQQRGTYLPIWRLSRLVT